MTIDAIYDKIRTALSSELNESNWIIFKEDARVVVERNSTEDDTVIKQEWSDDLNDKELPATDDFPEIPKQNELSDNEYEWKLSSQITNLAEQSEIEPKEKKKRGRPPKVLSIPKPKQGPKPKTNALSCKYCDKALPDRMSLARHVRWKHKKAQSDLENIANSGEAEVKNEDTKQKVCSECGEMVTNLDEHIARQHCQVKLWQCKDCEKQFPSKTKLTEHWRKYHDNAQCAMCDICGKQFSNKTKAKRHMTAVHFKEKCFCDVCGKECPHKEALYAHTFRNHSGKVYTCETCGQKFSIPENMKRHVQTIHLKTKISCDECGKEFTCKDHLRRHIKSIHDGKRYQCSMCDKNYSQAGDLHRHIKMSHKSLRAKNSIMQSVKIERTTETDDEDVQMNDEQDFLSDSEFINSLTNIGTDKSLSSVALSNPVPVSMGLPMPSLEPFISNHVGQLSSQSVFAGLSLLPNGSGSNSLIPNHVMPSLSFSPRSMISHLGLSQTAALDVLPSDLYHDQI